LAGTRPPRQGFLERFSAFNNLGGNVLENRKNFHVLGPQWSVERKRSPNEWTRTRLLNQSPRSKLKQDRTTREVVMAKVIEFYVPKNFRKPLQAPSRLHCGKVIKFCSQTKKSA
jgi:hypothetical protein